MYQRHSVYFILILVIIFVCSFGKVDCEDDGLEYWRKEDAYEKTASEERTFVNSKRKPWSTNQSGEDNQNTESESPQSEETDPETESDEDTKRAKGRIKHAPNKTAIKHSKKKDKTGGKKRKQKKENTSSTKRYTGATQMDTDKVETTTINGISTLKSKDETDTDKKALRHKKEMHSVKINITKVHNKKDKSMKDKQHLTTKRHNFDRNRDRSKEDKKREKQKVKQKLRHKQGEKKKIKDVIIDTDEDEKELKEKQINSNEDNKKSKEVRIDSISSEGKDSSDKQDKIKSTTKARFYESREKKLPKVERQIKKEQHFTVPYPEDSTRSTLKMAKGTPSNVRTDKKKENEPSMELLDAYSLRKQLQKMLCELQDTNVTISTIGRTAEYNDLLLLQASALCGHDDLRAGKDDDMQRKYEEDGPEKKIIFIVHGLSLWGFNSVPYLTSIPSFLLLLKNYLEHLDNFDIYIMPMANPDGASFNKMSQAWNKNMSPQDACPGVMLDRNFDVAWNEGPQVTSCSQQFAGEHAFSEPETQAIREVFHKLSHKIVAFIHVHGGSYSEHVFRGEAVLYPKGYSDAPGDDDKYVDLKGEIEEAMRNASFKVMTVTVDTLYNWYGKVTGTSVDYASTVYGIPYSLEFVMQTYATADPRTGQPLKENFHHAAQNEIWHRLIDVIFKYIHKTAIKKDASNDYVLRRNKDDLFAF